MRSKDRTEDARIHYAETQYGFEYGSAKVARFFSDPTKGWVTIGIDTPKAQAQVYVTKTGKMRVFVNNEEWFPPTKIPAGRRRRA